MPMSDVLGPAAAEPEPSTDEWLASLGNMPLVDQTELHEVLCANRPAYFVRRLAALPDDGGGVGTVSLYRIPAQVSEERRHQTTWAVHVVYEGSPDEVEDLAGFATEAEAVDWHVQRIDDRVSDRRARPN